MKFQPSRRKDDRGIRRVFLFFTRVFTVFGIAAFISVSLASITLFRAMNYSPPPLPDQILLSYKLKSNLFETAQKPSFSSALLRPPTTLHEIAESLDIAAKDGRVKGLMINIDSSDYSLAQIQELRDAIHRFRKSGKFTMVYADSFGGLGGGIGTYYLASSFDEIWMQPMGLLSINGIHSEVPFIKNIINKFGVYADFHHRGKFKSAVESLTLSGMSAAHREMMISIIDDLSEQITTGIAKDRNMKAPYLRNLINSSPYSGEEALANKLITSLDYYDVFLDKAKEKAGEDAEILDLLGYGFNSTVEEEDTGMVGFFSQLMHKKTPNSIQEDKKKIALIYGSGAIVPHKESTSIASPFSGIGGKTLFADKISRHIRKASKNDSIAAIVFRIDSPGGSPTAAETLRRAVVFAKDKGKKVVVSMGSTAASGGYWAVVDADYIIAEPATLTGSIGVFAGKIVLKDLWEKLGITWDSVSFGQNADMWSSNSTFSPTAQERFDAMLDHVYNSFVSRVAKGRNMSPEKVEELAQGRVWTGQQAQKNGLIDAVGGIEDAIAKAKEISEFKPEDDVPVIHYPARKSTLEMMITLFTEGAAFTPPISTQVPQELIQIYHLVTMPRISDEPLVISPVAAGLVLK